MGLFNRKENTAIPQQTEERKLNFGLGFNGISSFGANSEAMKLSAVYCAVNQIANAVALLPINIIKEENGKKEIVNHNLTDILNKVPNKRYNHYSMFKLLVESVLLRGNGYAYIVRDENLNIKEVQFINPAFVTPIPQADGTMKYIVSGMESAVDGINMIHLYMQVDENMRGISVIKYAFNTLKGYADAEKHSNNFFKSGANLSGILKATGAGLDNEKKKQIRDAWNAAFNTAQNSNPVPVAILPNNIDYQPLSVNPQDAQLLQSREFNVIEICRWFNIPPSKLFVMDNESYNSMEMAQISFLQDCIMPFVQMIKEEFDRKLFKPSERNKYHIDFDFDAILETDKKTLANYYKELLVNGIMSINEVRQKLNLEPIPDGDKHIMQLSYTTFDNIVSGNLLKNQNQTQAVDNKVKEKE